MSPISCCGATSWATPVLLRPKHSVGGADLIGILTGRFIALEVKRPKKGRESEEQQMFMQLVRAKGGFAAIVRSVDEAHAAIQRAREGASE